jgi:hypothetical protein
MLSRMFCGSRLANS